MNIRKFKEPVEDISLKADNGSSAKYVITPGQGIDIVCTSNDVNQSQMVNIKIKNINKYKGMYIMYEGGKSYGGVYDGPVRIALSTDGVNRDIIDYDRVASNGETKYFEFDTDLESAYLYFKGYYTDR